MSNTNPQPVPRLPNGGIDVAAVYDAALAKFTDDLAKNRFWELIPKTGGASVGIFDAQTGLRYPLASELKKFLDAHPFLRVLDDQKQYQATLQTAKRRLWVYLHQGSSFEPKDGAIKAAESCAAGLLGWRLPTKDELRSFATSDGNPHRVGQMYRLHSADYWLTADGRCDVDDGRWGMSIGRGYIFAMNEKWCGAHAAAMLADLAERGLYLSSQNDTARFLPIANKEWWGLSHGALMEALREGELHLQPHQHLRLGFPFADVVGQVVSWLFGRKIFE